MGKRGFGRYIYLREVDYYSNPDLVVVVAASLTEAKLIYRVMRMLSHEKFIRGTWENSREYQDPIMPYTGTPDGFVLRGSCMNRRDSGEPQYPHLIQQGVKAAKEEYLQVYLQVASHAFQRADAGVAVVPEIVVITAGSQKEAKQVLSEIPADHDHLVRTAMVSGHWGTEGEWIKVNQSIRQTFILRPKGTSDLR